MTGDGPSGARAVTGEERVQRALSVAYRLLNRRERTIAEMHRHLEQQDVSPAEVDATIALLVDQRYLDDARYVTLFAADKRRLEQWGTDRIRRTLRERGIDPEVIDAGLAAADGDGGDGELDRALEVLRRRFPQPPTQRRDRDRALGVLVRKGFDSELAVQALATHERDGAEHGASQRAM